MLLLCACRLNFSVADLAVVSPFYQHFRSCLDLTYSTSGGSLTFQAKQITTDFPQCFNYDRVKELVSEKYLLFLYLSFSHF